MGYTHYYYVQRHLSVTAFKRIAEDLNSIMPEFKKRKIKLCSYDDGDKPIITSAQIVLNGIGENSYLKFVLELNAPKGSYEQTNKDGLIFNFCKTARKPYDFVVCCALIIAKHHLGDQISISSDGNIEDEWVEPIKFIKEKFGYDDFHFSGD